VKIFAFLTKLSSTEFALFKNDEQIYGEVIEHSPAELNALLTPCEQGDFRFDAMIDRLVSQEIPIDDVNVLITQGGVEALPGGIYLVNRDLEELMKESRIDENLPRSAVFVAGHLLDYMTERYDNECLALLVEPAADNEIMSDGAPSGLKGVTRAPFFHAFSHRAAASVWAWDMKRGQNDVRLVVAHLGTEISVGAFDRGRIVDSNSPLDGEGPFSPTTCGTLPTDALLELCYSGKYDMDEMMSLVAETGGLAAHLGDGGLESVQDAYARGEEKTVFMVKAMAYKVAREIGARAAALYGKIDGIVLTGPWSFFNDFVAEITSRVEWMAPTKVIFWGSELYLLNTAAARTFEGNVRIDLYGQDQM
jgi:butyrate kinase